MQPNVSALWRRLPPDLNTRIEKCIRTGCEKAEGQGAGYLFFRADDVAVPGRQFSRMMDLFSTYGVPIVSGGCTCHVDPQALAVSEGI